MLAAARPLLVVASVLPILAIGGDEAPAEATPRSLARQDERPRVLITNDDGIRAPGIRALAKELSAIAEVTVCAPAGNRSGASQSITVLSRPVLVKELEVDGATIARSLDGTPADCAHFGLFHLAGDRPYNLLISGINHGVNVGDHSHGSGTVGAAMEAASHGVPGIAVSMQRGAGLTDATAFVRKFVEQLFERGPDASVVYSINIPRGGKDDWKGAEAVPMGGAYYYLDGYRAVGEEDGGTSFRGALKTHSEFPEGTDSAACFGGSISITPLHFDWTHREALEDLKDWDFGLGEDENEEVRPVSLRKAGLGEDEPVLERGPLERRRGWLRPGGPGAARDPAAPRVRRATLTATRSGSSSSRR